VGGREEGWGEGRVKGGEMTQTYAHMNKRKNKKFFKKSSTICNLKIST
jgi:hypothetical protein